MLKLLILSSLIAFFGVIDQTTTQQISLDRLCPTEVIYGKFEFPITMQDI